MEEKDLSSRTKKRARAELSEAPRSKSQKSRQAKKASKEAKTAEATEPNIAQNLFEPPYERTEEDEKRIFF
jgi:hypothetical protein